MIYLVCALYGEAEPWITKFSLKKQTAFHKVQVFANEQMLCIVTGVGAMAAATALTEVLTVRQLQGELHGEDVLVNIGVCGCKDTKVPTGTAYLCHSIQDGATGRTYYPDILYRHPFLESSLFSSARPLTQEDIQTQSCQLVDMEGAGIYQSGIRFLETHRMFFVKIVSDYGTKSDTVTSEDIRALIAQNLERTVMWMEPWLTGASAAPIFTQEQEAELQELCHFLKASVTMEQEIRQLLTWCQLTDGNGVDRLKTFLKEQGVEAIQSKREGALQLARFRQQLF